MYRVAGFHLCIYRRRLYEALEKDSGGDGSVGCIGNSGESTGSPISTHQQAGQEAQTFPVKRIFFFAFFSSRTVRDLSVTRPCFLFIRCRTLVAPVTYQVQGIGRFLKEISSHPWQVNLPRKTDVGTTPPPTVADSQILWLSLQGVQSLYGSRRGRPIEPLLQRVMFEGRNSVRKKRVRLA